MSRRSLDDGICAGRYRSLHKNVKVRTRARAPRFHEIGKKAGKIDVRVSYRIIQLFSDGLYSSPNKAVEELVSNAWDAGADHTHVILPADRDAADAKIVVIDDGTGMDEAGLRQHWLLGDSKKRIADSVLPKGRKPIGKFGIGKLATYVLANRLTHITRVDGRYFSTSMDYRRIDQGAGEATTEKVVSLPLRELTKTEAQQAVAEWASGTTKGHKALKLFGAGAAKSWTVAVMSDLKQMAKELSPGRLRWVLETAMPLGDDFRLYLNGEPITSAKLKAKKVGVWVLGRDVGTEDTPLPKPAPDEIEESEDETADEESPDRFGIFHPELLRMTGYIEAYEDELAGKSENWGHSNGFFVYVRGRRINVDDPGFGIDRNKLQHGTFSRFRMIINIDSLDDELRSSRETVREGDKLLLAKAVLWAGFNFARSRLAEHSERTKPGAAMAARVADSPASLTARPIYSLLAETLEGRATPRYIDVPKNLSKEKRLQLLESFESFEDEEFRLVENAELAVLAPQDGIARYDVSTRVLRINTMHPFVAQFLNEFQNSTRSLPLDLFAMSEVLLEAHLYQTVAEEERVQEVLLRRDQLLRHLAKTTGRKNAFLIAQDLVEAAQDKAGLERELVNAFASLGFEAVPRGGPGKPDGVADAHLSASTKGQRSYRVSLESKSKEKPQGKVSAKTVSVSAIARQRDDFDCDHAIVVGPDFPASKEGKSALEKEIDKSQGRPAKTITLMRVSDLARLVRVQPQKRIGLDTIRELFTSCTMPDECAAWVTKIEALRVEEPPYREILDAIWEIQKDEPESQVEYGKLKTALRLVKKLQMQTDELRVVCQAMTRLAGSGYIFATDLAVELNQKPDKVLEAVRSVAEEKPFARSAKKKK